jgi:hypothetical protein
MSQPIAGTVAEAYLRNRGITDLPGTGCLRFHPRCYYRPDAWSPTETWPAMIAAVTDLDAKITGAHRTWLDPSGDDMAPIDTPRRAMGHLLGNAVRFGVGGEIMAAGEGIETMLSLRCVMPAMPMAAALSAAHLAAILFPETVRRLYIARDDDPAGDGAMATLSDAHSRSESRRLPCRLASVTSTEISARLASVRLGNAEGPDRTAGRRALHGAGGMTGIGRAGIAGVPESHRVGHRRFPSPERTAPTAF